MNYVRAIALAAGITAVLAGGASAEDKTPETTAEATPKCLEAAVNPVTGYAICINPTGAPVEQLPRSSLNRPCKPRAHDNEDWTVYEHWSGC